MLFDLFHMYLIALAAWSGSASQEAKDTVEPGILTEPEPPRQVATDDITISTASNGTESPEPGPRPPKPIRPTIPTLSPSPVVVAKEPLVETNATEELASANSTNQSTGNITTGTVQINNTEVIDASRRPPKPERPHTPMMFNISSEEDEDKTDEMKFGNKTDTYWNETHSVSSEEIDVHAGINETSVTNSTQSTTVPTTTTKDPSGRPPKPPRPTHITPKSGIMNDAPPLLFSLDGDPSVQNSIVDANQSGGRQATGGKTNAQPVFTLFMPRLINTLDCLRNCHQAANTNPTICKLHSDRLIKCRDFCLKELSESQSNRVLIDGLLGLMADFLKTGC